MRPGTRYRRSTDNSTMRLRHTHDNEARGLSLLIP
ncbi:MAG: hypothetical protein JWQ68_1520 [Cryobacterium sp.]|jgi:hypothetical protein|nr:hypothetical protein [Cryobacterium sp.]